jgi:DNA-binding transcriptional LysR family regulator
MEFIQLEYFLALNQYKHFALAAESVHVSQPALSYGIKLLENDLGVQLINRAKRPVQLTNAGIEFVPYARSILLKRDDAKNAMLDHTKFLKGTVKIGTIPIVTYFHLIPFLAAFKEHYPEIVFEVDIDNSDSLVDKLIGREIDVAFVSAGHASKASFDHISFTSDEIVALFPSSHKLASRPVISYYTLMKEKLVLSNHIKDMISPICKQFQFEPRILFTGNRIKDHIMVELVEEEGGIGILSSIVAKHLVSEKTTIVGLIPKITTDIELIRLEDNRSLVTKAFCLFYRNNLELLR